MPARARRTARHVDGVLLLDKPRGITSQTAVTRARHALEAAKTGHTGTLDPMADGLLPLCFGEATKFSQFALDSDKAYRATIRLGVTTTTGDAEGEVTGGVPRSVSRDQMERTLEQFVGDIHQTPPMHSAIRQGGRRLYEMARAGLVVERAARKIHIERIDLLSFENDRLEIDVACSKGTYIRVLAEDIGASLGCGAHLAALTRTRVGRFQLEDAIGLDTLCGMAADTAATILLPVECLARDLPRVILDTDLAKRFMHGQTVSLTQTAGNTGPVRAYAPSDLFLGVGELDGQGNLKPRRLLASAPGQGFG